jgi:hypothetical protein
VAHVREGEPSVDISIESVVSIRVSEVEEYDLDDDDEDDEPFSRTITIETASGAVIELDLNAASEEALELLDDEDEEEDE